MPYTAEVSRNSPTCVLFLIDQSSSMAKPFGGKAGRSKADGVAEAVNRFLHNLVLKCTKSDGVRDYFHVGVIGYGEEARPSISGPAADLWLLPIGTIANAPKRVEKRTRQVDDGTGQMVEEKYRFPVWFEPVAKGKTPMCQAMKQAREVLADFVAKHPASYPPMVIHLTDGAATDGDPRKPAEAIRDLATSDGNVMLFNLHLSSRDVPPVVFPADEAGLPDDFAKLLFRTSSELPPRLRIAAQAEGFTVKAGSRGFVLNSDLVAVVRFLNVGTRASGG
jgi:hypothetical protein